LTKDYLKLDQQGRDLKGRPPFLWRYGIAVVTTAVALLLGLATGGASPFLAFAPAVMISAWYGGLGPGLLVIVMGSLAGDYFFLPPGSTFGGLSNIHRVALFVFVALLISLLVMARKRAEDTLLETNETLQALIHASPLAIILLDEAKNVKLWTEAARRILGWKASDVLGRSIPAVPADIQQDFNSDLDAAMRGKLFTGYETRFQRKDGSVINVSIWTAPLRAAKGRIGGVVAMIADNTERKRMEEERTQLLAREQEARREAEEANRAKDVFLATVSHELRTPLNSILGWAQILRLRGSKLDADELAQAIETIERNARLQERLVEDLLDVSRAVNGNLNFEFRPVALVPIIDAALEAIRPLAEAKAIQLRVLLDTNVDEVIGDSGRLQQAIGNLLSNAIKFTPNGGSVEVRLKRSDGNAQITVSDTGEGISQDFLPYVFEPFRQANGLDMKGGGMGLGLAIARHIVESHGGRVQAYNEGKGMGTSFTIKLPLVAFSGEVNAKGNGG
jgi:PAS domain S-box-containing protein